MLDCGSRGHGFDPHHTHKNIHVYGVNGSIAVSKTEGPSSNLGRRANKGLVAQLVERWTEDPSVGGSTPSRSTNN